MGYGIRRLTRLIVSGCFRGGDRMGRGREFATSAGWKLLGTGILVTGPGLRVEDSLITNPATNNSAVGTPGGHGYGIFAAARTMWCCAAT